MNPKNAEQKITNILSWLIILILVLLPFHAVFTTWIGANTGHLDLIRIWKEILITAMTPAAIWLAWRDSQLKSWLLKGWLPRLIYIYFGLTFTVGAWALGHHQVNKTALIYSLVINLRFFGFFLICLIVGAKTQRLINNWLKILLAPAAAVILFGFLQKIILPEDFLRHFGYGPKTIPAYQTVDAQLDYQRIQSTLRGANPLGAYLSLVIAGYLFIKSYIFRCIGIAAGLVVLFFTYSRSAWLGLLVTLLALLWLKYGKSAHFRFASAIIASLIVVGGIGAYALRSSQSVQDTLLHTSSNSTSAKSSNSVRTAAIKKAAHQVARQPFGEGPGSAGPASFRNNHPARIAENYYLQIGQEVGWLGIALFVVINFMVASLLWRGRSHRLRMLLLASLAGISLINLVSHAWTDDTLSLLWWGLAGIGVAPVILAKDKHYAKKQP